MDEVASVFSFGVGVYLLIGVAGATLIHLFAAGLAVQVFSVPQAMVPLAVRTLHVAAFGFLFGQMQAYLQSVPQALLRYDVSARIETVFGVLAPLSGVAVIAAGYGLYELILVRVLLSALNCLWLWGAVRRLLPGLQMRRPEARLMREVSSFSAYSFLSRVTALSYAHADKLIIGAYVGLTPLAYYTVASTLGNRVLSLLYRVSAVMFPASSALAARGDYGTLRRLYLRMNRYVGFANAGVLLVVVGFAEPLLHHWMGADFARSGALVLQLMALAQFIDSLTNVPSLVNDGLGHPRVSGAFAISRALLGLAVVFIGVLQWGIYGAAWGHVASALVLTGAFLVYVHGRTIPCRLAELWRQALLPAGPVLLASLGLCLLVGRFGGGSLTALLLGIGLSAVLLGWAGWRWILWPEDRAAWLAGLRRLISRTV
jgi:O-antigen/teichoic acid export membrane protein